MTKYKHIAISQGRQAGKSSMLHYVRGRAFLNAFPKNQRLPELLKTYAPEFADNARAQEILVKLSNEEDRFNRLLSGDEDSFMMGIYIELSAIRQKTRRTSK